MKRSLLITTVGVAFAVSAMFAGTATSEDGSRDRRMGAKVIDIATAIEAGGGRGTLQYDDGIPVSRFPAIGTPNLWIGNNFNTGLPTATPHIVTAVSVNMAGFFGALFNMGFFDAGPGPVPATPAPVLAEKTVAAAGPGWQSVVFITPVPGVNNPLLVGVANTTFPACSGNIGLGSTCEGVAIGPGSNGFLHNAMRISQVANGAPGTGYATIMGPPSTVTLTPQVPQNALIRISGTNIPVELMRLEVE